MKSAILLLVEANLGSQTLVIVGKKIGFKTISYKVIVVDNTGSCKICKSRIGF